MRASGLKCDGQGLGFNGAVDDPGSLQILGEQVVPGVHLFGVNQQDSASYIADFGEVFFGSLSDVHDGNMAARRKRRGPCDGNRAQSE